MDADEPKERANQKIGKSSDEYQHTEEPTDQDVGLMVRLLKSAFKRKKQIQLEVENLWMYYFPSKHVKFRLRGAVFIPLSRKRLSAEDLHTLEVTGSNVTRKMRPLYEEANAKRPVLLHTRDGKLPVELKKPGPEDKLHIMWSSYVQNHLDLFHEGCCVQIWCVATHTALHLFVTKDEVDLQQQQVEQRFEGSNEENPLASLPDFDQPAGVLLKIPRTLFQKQLVLTDIHSWLLLPGAIMIYLMKEVKQRFGHELWKKSLQVWLHTNAGSCKVTMFCLVNRKRQYLLWKDLLSKNRGFFKPGQMVKGWYYWKENAPGPRSKLHIIIVGE